MSFTSSSSHAADRPRRAFTTPGSPKPSGAPKRKRVPVVQPTTAYSRRTTHPGALHRPATLASLHSEPHGQSFVTSGTGVANCAAPAVQRSNTRLATFTKQVTHSSSSPANNLPRVVDQCLKHTHQSLRSFVLHNVKSPLSEYDASYAQVALMWRFFMSLSVPFGVLVTAALLLRHVVDYTSSMDRMGTFLPILLVSIPVLWLGGHAGNSITSSANPSAFFFRSVMEAWADAHQDPTAKDVTETIAPSSCNAATCRTKQADLTASAEPSNNFLQCTTEEAMEFIISHHDEIVARSRAHCKVHNKYWHWIY